MYTGMQFIHEIFNFFSIIVKYFYIKPTNNF